MNRVAARTQARVRSKSESKSRCKSRCIQCTDKSQNCVLNNPAEMLVVSFDGVQKLQKLEERLQTMVASLALNADALEVLQDVVPAHARVDVARHVRNAEMLLRRAGGSSRLMYNVLEYQHYLAIQGNMRTGGEMETGGDDKDIVKKAEKEKGELEKGGDDKDIDTARADNKNFFACYLSRWSLCKK
ncbi:hypothetical protein EDC01DRAFT_634557 [Geopyxis carbonaria]|nr:hypothetical protein EDC01DRAFT_634557 [Geopyxis carbonaria]